ncbi:hypothetical protein VTL71DRAFT_8295 [Oculimacula yallundae]|uniref:Uncharacterized protein n=1 Tax=Oculimacula yallundae TaxID=86028 RepID=A0ABR4CXD6_9HELO
MATGMRSDLSIRPGDNDIHSVDKRAQPKAAANLSDAISPLIASPSHHITSQVNLSSPAAYSDLPPPTQQRRPVSRTFPNTSLLSAESSIEADLTSLTRSESQSS